MGQGIFHQFYLLQILLGPLLNTLSHVIETKKNGITELSKFPEYQNAKRFLD